MHLPVCCAWDNLMDIISTPKSLTIFTECQGEAYKGGGLAKGIVINFIL